MKQAQQLNQQGNGANANSAAVIAQKEALVAELKNKLGAHEKEKQDIAIELNRTREETKKVQSELDRLLKIMSASEEEKFSLNKQVQELQKELQNSLRQQQQQQMRSQQQQQQQQRPPNQGPQTQTTTQLANQHRRNSSTASKPPPQQPAPAPPQQQQGQVRGAVPPRQGQPPPQQQNAAGPRPGQGQGPPRQAAPQNVNKPNQQPPKPPNQQQQQQQVKHSPFFKIGLDLNFKLI